jgi:antitoxin component YwqK of YwqJK toxin-antitoxin module
MRKTIIILFVTFISIKCLAQVNEKIKDGYQVFKYPNGTVSSEGFYKNGKPDGFWKSYYVTGVKHSEGKYSTFLLDSIWVFFDQAGDTTEKINYLFGKKNGYYYSYKKDPSHGLYLWSKELYAGNKKEGIGFVYYPNGKIQQTFAYNGGKKEGLSKEYDKEGNVITILEYSNDFLVTREKINRTDSKGLKQGDWKDFYPDERIKTEKTYKDDQLHGYYKEYDIRGNLTVTMLYDNGSLVKSRVEDEPNIEMAPKYDNEGNLISNGPYRNNVPVGIHREYTKDGKVSNAFIYNDVGLLLSEGIVDDAGNYNGKWKDFYPDGKVQAEGSYNDNRRSGLWKFYASTGNVIQTGSYNNGRPDGLCTEYSINGDIISQGQYSDGEKNGDWKFQAGDNTEEGKYIIGLKDGQWKSYYSNGNLKFKGIYNQGNPDGQHLFYYENGKLKEEQNYRMGLRQKTWKKFDEEGVPFLTITYKDDVEISINGVKINLPESEMKLIK